MTVPRVEILKINSTRPELIGLGPKKEIYKKNPVLNLDLTLVKFI